MNDDMTPRECREALVSVLDSETQTFFADSGQVAIDISITNRIWQNGILIESLIRSYLL
jgi:hypothetical protein